MSPSLFAAFGMIACHGGPADHFAAFANHLLLQGRPVEIFASGPALEKLAAHALDVPHPFSLEGLSTEEQEFLAGQIAHDCRTMPYVLMDLGHPFSLLLTEAFALHAPDVLLIPYYDNPEPYVPGGYSELAAQAMLPAKKILFANARLAQEPIFQQPGIETPLPLERRTGIGYYPVSHARGLSLRREKERDLLRSQLLAQQGIADQGQPIWVYCGGNNEEYFSRAFPAFLRILQESRLRDILLLFQQHPGAKKENRDGALFSEWSAMAQIPCLMSHISTEEALALADGVFYYQTSMSPLLALAGIPAIQIGHASYPDLLVRNHFCPSVTQPGQLGEAMATAKQQNLREEDILQALGYQDDWAAILEKALGS